MQEALHWNKTFVYIYNAKLWANVISASNQVGLANTSNMLILFNTPESRKVDDTQGVTTPFSPYIFSFYWQIIAGETRKVVGNITNHRRFLTTLLKRPPTCKRASICSTWFASSNATLASRAVEAACKSRHVICQSWLMLKGFYFIIWILFTGL